MYKIVVIGLLFIILGTGLSLASSDREIQYDRVGNDLFPGYDKAALIVNYFYTDGISNSDRYSYEIIVIDNVLAISFRSPETADFNKINFKTKRTLTNNQVASLINTLRMARLKQIKEGMPRPDCSAHTREALIVRSKELTIAGGMFYCNVFDPDDSEVSINKQIEDDKKESSSIDGNYQAVFTLLDSFFIEKKRLLKKVYKE